MSTCEMGGIARPTISWRRPADHQRSEGSFDAWLVWHTYAGEHAEEILILMTTCILMRTCADGPPCIRASGGGPPL